jgi:4-hydroxy-2-oxoglutarate aldolase
MLNLRGVFAPVVTTFGDRDETVDLDAFATNLRAYAAAGLSGVVVCGSTGEAALLDEGERRSLIEQARRELWNDALLIVGTGAESTRQCVERCRVAKEHGAHAVLVVAPHYYASAMTPAALEAHYHRVADESPLPVLLYNIPKYMHFALPRDVVADLARHPNIAGIKDSSGNKEMLAGFMESRSAGFSVLVGNGALLLHALSSGATGGILGVSLFAPSLAVEIYSAFKRNDVATATFVQERLAPLHTKIVAELGVAGVKAALDAVKLTGGPTRSPLLPLGPAERRELATLLQTAELVAA